ncbi:hypothetical protein GIB67_035447 [Kingdonia uniflora]|uniref:Uncharacterized protein n=1 Tax=Kingdonia uniflora TaxID=39325 RepID=A0A7J7P0M3_9MAGN|nr:hypothetical protein GIB67_035447 [Kingdonia uniflora]
MEEEEGEELIRASDSNSTHSSTIGRVISTLLNLRPKKLENAISRLGLSSKRGSLEEQLWLLKKYVRDAVEKGEGLDQFLIPLVEDSLKWKNSRDCNQVIILLNWLFEDQLLLGPLATNLVQVLMRRDDHYVAFGWCKLVCGYVDREINMNTHSNTGNMEGALSLLLL